MDTTQTTTHIGLCAGYGGIELGLKRVIPNMRSVALCEIEAFACANLVAKMEAGLMDAAPIWSDLKTFPWAEFSGRVDILTGGYPCQPFSAAGKRAGKDDPRHLWPWIADGIRLLQPQCCYFENVEGHITLGLSTVISDLEEMGYRTTWGIFSASEVGAPHQRKRVFIVGELANARFSARCAQQWKQQAQHSKVVQGSVELAHDDRQRGAQYSLPFAIQTQLSPAHSKGHGGNVWPSRPGEPQHEWEPPRVVGAVPAKLADFCSRDSQSWGDTTQTSGESVGTWGQSEDAMPNCGSSLCGGNQGNESTPRVVGDSKLQGLEGRTIGSDDHTEELAKGCAGETESSLGRDTDGPAHRMDDAKLYVTCDNRTDELRLLGNGVVPATAEKAFRVLMQKMHE